MFSTIMIPVDLAHADSMQKGLSVAADLAQRQGASVHLVGVTMSQPTEIAKTPEAFAEKLAAFASDKSTEFGITFQPHTRLSHDLSIDLDSILAKSAEELGADLIIMASHVPGFSEHIFASNAGYIASHVSMSVLIVR